MVDFKKSNWTTFANALGQPDQNLQYAKGGGLVTALMAGLKGYGQTRGNKEDEVLRQSATDALNAQKAEQQNYDRGQDQFTNQLLSDKFGLQKDQFSYGQGQDTIKNQLAQDQFGYGKEKDTRNFGLATDKFAHTKEYDAAKLKNALEVADKEMLGAAATGLGAGALNNYGYSSKKAYDKAGTVVGEAQGNIEAGKIKKAGQLAELEGLIGENASLLTGFDDDLQNREDWANQGGLARSTGNLLRKSGLNVSPTEADARSQFNVIKESRVASLGESLKGLGPATEKEVERIAASAMKASNPYELDLVLNQGKSNIEAILSEQGYQQGQPEQSGEFSFDQAWEGM